MATVAERVDSDVGMEAELGVRSHRVKRVKRVGREHPVVLGAELALGEVEAAQPGFRGSIEEPLERVGVSEPWKAGGGGIDRDHG